MFVVTKRVAFNEAEKQQQSYIRNSAKKFFCLVVKIFDYLPHYQFYYTQYPVSCCTKWFHFPYNSLFVTCCCTLFDLSPAALDALLDPADPVLTSKHFYPLPTNFK